jgi:hypothetical protein
MKRQRIITALCIVTGLIIVLLASLRSATLSPGQIVPGPPTTPQPTVPCTPVNGCGRGPGTQRDVAYAWIDRYCNGDAVPTPPGETTFAVNYGLGGQASGPVQFFGVATMNGAVIPTAPLAILQPGQKDTRVRAAIVPDGAVFEVTITGTVLATGAPVVFGNGTDTRVRMASGTCPTTTPLAPAPPTTVPVDSTIPGAPPPAAPPPVGTPPINTLPPGAVFPPAL